MFFIATLYKCHLQALEVDEDNDEYHTSYMKEASHKVYIWPSKIGRGLVVWGKLKTYLLDRH